MSVAPEKLTLGELEQNLAEAQEAYHKADHEYRVASTNQTNAMNRLNQAQKAIDDKIAKIRAEAVRNSDWANEKVRVTGISA